MSRNARLLGIAALMIVIILVLSIMSKWLSFDDYTVGRFRIAYINGGYCVFESVSKKLVVPSPNIAISSASTGVFVDRYEIVNKRYIVGSYTSRSRGWTGPLFFIFDTQTAVLNEYASYEDFYADYLKL